MSKWIDTKIKLPENNNRVLVRLFIPEKKVNDVIVMFYYNGGFYPGDSEFMKKREKYNFVKNVTHWMPLPELPND